MQGSGSWVEGTSSSGDGEHEVHAQVLQVPEQGFEGVAAAAGHVVDLADLHRVRPRKTGESSSAATAARRLKPQRALWPLSLIPRKRAAAASAAAVAVSAT